MQAESVTEQLRFVTQERDDCRQRLNEKEDQLIEQETAVRNLQMVLDTFHKGRSQITNHLHFLVYERVL